MSGELYGLSGPRGRVASPPTPATGQGAGDLIDLGKLFSGGLIGALLGGGQTVEVPDGMSAGDYLAALMGLRWMQMDDFADEQLAIRDQVALLSQLEDTGSSYANGSGALVNVGKVAFNNPLGPEKGCQLVNGGWLLGDYGRWDIEARMAFSYTIGPGGIGWQIRVYRPDGTLYSYQHDGHTDSNSNTRGMHTSVVVPTAGYRVEVWITTLVIGRATIGGAENTRLTVNHITRSIENPN